VRFLADMGVDVRIVEWLRREGHDAHHLRDEGLQRMPDTLGIESADSASERRRDSSATTEDSAAMGIGHAARLVR
jgi:hypothetical protein